MFDWFASDLRYAAGLIRVGSDVLGFDTERSMDHDWDIRLRIILRPDDNERWRSQGDTPLLNHLPATVRTSGGVLAHQREGRNPPAV